MQPLITVLLGALLFAGAALFIRSIAIWIGLWRESAQIRRTSRERKWVLGSQTREDIEALGMLACQRAAHGAAFEQIKKDLVGKGWPKRMVVQIADDAPVAASKMAGTLVATGVAAGQCIAELQRRPYFTPPVIKLAMFCAATAHPRSAAAAGLSGATDYEWKYNTACASLEEKSA